MSYKCNNNITYSCKYHVIWCSKYRRKVLVEEVGQRLKELIVGVASELRVDIIEMEIMPDHVHLLLEVDPQFGIHRAVKNIKGKTSRILRAEFISLRTRLPSLSLIFHISCGRIAVFEVMRSCCRFGISLFAIFSLCKNKKKPRKSGAF